MNFTPVDFDPFEEIDTIIPTSESQRELLSSIRFGNDAANCAYNESVSIKLSGFFNYEALVKAANAVVSRHGSLRATFIEEGLKMRIASNIIIDVPLIDISEISRADQDAHLNEIILEDVSSPFDLPNGPLFDVKIVRLNEVLHYVIITAHHIVCDGWSTGIVMQDLSRFYNKFAYNIEADIEPAVQFDEYVSGEVDFENSENFKETETYWLNLFKNYTDVFEIPADKPRPALRSYNAKRFDIDIKSEVVSVIKKSGLKNGCSLVNTLIAAFEVYLFRITRKEEIVVGLPSAGQAVTDNYSLVGHCVNLLPLKTSVDGTLAFSEYLRNRKKTLLDAFENQRYTFGTLIKKLNVPRDPSRIPLVPIAFNTDLGLSSGVYFENLEMEVHSNPRLFENFEIFVNVTGQDDDLKIECTFNTDLYDEDGMRNRMEEFIFLLGSLAENFDQIIDQLELLPLSEKTLIDSWNATEDKNSLNGQLQSMFESQVIKSPDAIAIKFNNQSYTYKQLDDYANRLANLLVSQNLRAGQLVGICIDRSPEMIITMLGILKAGGAYLPIDPDFPADRIGYMIENSELKFLITDEKIDALLKFNCDYIFHIDNWETKLPKTITAPLTSYNANDLAYVLYTSGSTGLPKGVMIYNYSIVNLLNSFTQITQFKASDVLLALTTISFDIAELEIFMPLINGGTLCIASKEDAADPRSIAALLEKNQATFMQATPATWRMLTESGWKGNSKLNALCGGEALPVDLALSLLKLNNKVWNVYGPTETTVWSSTYLLSSEEISNSLNNSLIKIGKPISNTTFFILDPNLKPLPIGIEGDIYIGGAGLAKGYLNKPELTAERFLNSPFSNSLSTHIYKTGDLGKYNKNGLIEYTGRSDFQVKVRGFRIELGEIETAISNVAEVSAVAVVTVPDKNNENQLVAYVTEHTATNIADKEQHTHVKDWKEKWDLIYDAGIRSIEKEDLKDRKLDTAIAQQISGQQGIELEVDEWLAQTLERVKLLKPKRVYEIGCGAGQILLNIAGNCDYYYATDYAAIALDELQLRIDYSFPELKTKVELGNRMADDFSGIEDESFDTIIINSVVQYFPDGKYLERVIQKSIKALKPGGCLYIGDVQSNMLLEMHHTYDQLKRIDVKQPVERLRRLIKNRITGELEFAADTAFFELIKLQNKELTFSKYLMRKGRINNETTNYHYDVFLYKDTPHKESVSETWLDWNKDIKSIEKLTQQLTLFTTDKLLISNVPNKRLINDKTALELIMKSKDDLPCGIIVDQLSNLPLAFDPQDLWDLAAKLGFVAEIYWTDSALNAMFDISFIKQENYDFNLDLSPNYFSNPVNISNISSYANEPYKADQNQVLIKKIKQHLEKNLPHYMLPAAYKVLPKMPLTANGKIDRKGLPDIEIDAKKSSEEHVAPITETEKAVAKIWQTLLNVENIGLNDNFFELGGHSIIAVRLMIEIEHLKNIRLPLAVLFTNPTIGKLVEVLENESASELWKSITPIRTTGDKKPFFFAHGVSGNVFKYHALGKILREDIPSYGLQAFGLNGVDKPYSDLGLMAGYHVKEILKMQPSGPYFLGGGSFGGTLAYEIACQLEKMGHKIGLVALFDVEAATKSELLEGVEKQLVEIKLKSQRVVSRLKLLANQSMDENLTYLKNKINNKNPNADARKKQIDQWLDKDLIAEKYGTISADYFNNIEESCYKALKNYHIQSANFDVVLFRAKNGFYSNIEYNEDLGWSNFTKSKIEVVYVPGNHNSIFDYPHVPELASALTKHIDKFYLKSPSK